MISSTIDKIRLKEFDRQLGAGFGLLKGAATCCLVTMFAMTLLGPNQKTAIARSKSGQYIAQALTHAGAIMPDEVKQVIGPYIANFERQLEQGRAPEGYPIPVDVQGANGTSFGNELMRGIGLDGPTGPNSGGPNIGGPNSSAGGILERFLGNSSRSVPAPQNQPQYNPQGAYPPPQGNQGSVPVLPPLPF
jgi:membrane protein required for colicin V production